MAERDEKGRFIKGHKQLNTGKSHFKKGVKVRLGAKHSEETKKKLSEIHKVIPHNIEGLLNYKKPKGVDSHMWKGDDVGYSALHKWVYKHKGKARFCEKCGTDKNVEWANKSWQYFRSVEDWIALCRKHHKEYDKKYKTAFKFLEK